MVGKPLFPPPPPIPPHRTWLYSDILLATKSSSGKVRAYWEPCSYRLAGSDATAARGQTGSPPSPWAWSSPVVLRVSVEPAVCAEDASSHAMHSVCPSSGWKVLAWQARHSGAPALGATVPAGHEVHAVSAVPNAKVPGSQDVHRGLADAGVTVPALHSSQRMLPSWLANRPGRQAVQKLWLSPLA